MIQAFPQCKPCFIFHLSIKRLSFKEKCQCYTFYFVCLDFSISFLKCFFTYNGRTKILRFFKDFFYFLRIASWPSLYCFLRVRVPATSVVGLRSGCFCPDEQMLAEDHKQICVSECTSKWLSLPTGQIQPNISKRLFF